MEGYDVRSKLQTVLACDADCRGREGGGEAEEAVSSSAGVYDSDRDCDRGSVASSMNVLFNKHTNPYISIQRD